MAKAILKDVSSLSPKMFGSKWATQRFEADHGSGILSLGDTASFDYRHVESSARLELKSSRPSTNGCYSFQNINPELFDVGIFLAYQPNAEPLYWVIPSISLCPFLTRQHRDAELFQMRVPPKSRDKLSRFSVENPKSVAQKLRGVCRFAMQKEQRRRVFLHAVFSEHPGWTAVKRQLNNVLMREFDPKWIIRILPAPYDENGLVPYPSVEKSEFRFDFYAGLDSSPCGHSIRHTVNSIVDLLYQCLEQMFEVKNKEDA
jgi:hypothetical protein